ncbi:hypothetical protein ACOI1H_20265 [Loktanella sp. DJP18]|uniref:hypothetical protein n=1 Tax=Loktanella sp. DJP18 TaxID=3409788 RepID=UPI003BB59372
MKDFNALALAHQHTWESCGYSLTIVEGLPSVGGDNRQFYCDVVANDCGAAELMNHIRTGNLEECDRYRARAADDGIDLDASQDIFMQITPQT